MSSSSNRQPNPPIVSITFKQEVPVKLAHSNITDSSLSHGQDKHEETTTLNEWTPKENWKKA